MQRQRRGRPQARADGMAEGRHHPSPAGQLAREEDKRLSTVRHEGTQTLKTHKQLGSWRCSTPQIHANTRTRPHGDHVLGPLRSYSASWSATSGFENLAEPGRRPPGGVCMPGRPTALHSQPHTCPVQQNSKHTSVTGTEGAAHSSSHIPKHNSPSPNLPPPPPHTHAPGHTPSPTKHSPTLHAHTMLPRPTQSHHPASRTSARNHHCTHPPRLFRLASRSLTLIGEA
jgi:hypothetical protein